MTFWRPILSSDPARPRGAEKLADGWLWFDRCELLSRARAREVVPIEAVPLDVLERLTAARAPLPGLARGRPAVMGIVNTTPDSFSDGGRYHAIDSAVAGASRMARDADILDIGGESTRPGAQDVDPEEETARTAPVIAALRASGLAVPISIDTRKAQVARAALEAGADMVNDVSAFSYDPGLAGVVASAKAPVCLMHAQGSPQSMQDDPRYDDVLLDVYEALAARIAHAEAAGVARARILVDPGIGFGKTQAHNLALLARLSLFHSLGCAVLLGASRKRFIGEIGGGEIGGRPAPISRMPGSVAVALAAVAQGAQIVRVHDVAETRQALRLWGAVTEGEAGS